MQKMHPHLFAFTPDNPGDDSAPMENSRSGRNRSGSRGLVTNDSADDLGSGQGRGQAVGGEVSGLVYARIHLR